MTTQIPIRSSIASSWRVTPANPVRATSGLDYERCAALHNELLEIAWTRSGRSLDILERKSWFEFYGTQAEAIRGRLSKDIIAFLENAIEVAESNFHLFYYVAGLSTPDMLWTNHEYKTEDRFLTLYIANDLASHLDGLVFDQEENKAIIQMSIFDAGCPENGRQPWYPLEVVLSAWLDMIDANKVQTMPGEINGLLYHYDPWIIVPWSAHQLEETINTFHRLVDSIEGLRPRAEQSQSPSETGSLLSEEDLDAAHIPPGFAHSFLSKARRPRFRYIAPGLSLPDPTSFPSQPFSSIACTQPLDEDEDEDEQQQNLGPILLFPTSESYHAPEDGSHDEEPPFDWPYNQIQSFPAGLYLNPCDRKAANAFEDTVKLVLPFGMGCNGFARTSDGAPFGDDRESETWKPRDTHTDLYQPGYQPFVEWHGVRLVKVFESWIGMIERGDWKVDLEGVQGTIEDFKEADTGGGWAKFVVPVSW